MFSEDEILGTVKECGGSKSIRSDEFNFNFIRSNWGIIVDDIVKAVKWFYYIGFIPKGCNASFITLIPKCQNSSKLGPISLVGCLYKIIAKTLANRLKSVLDKFIDQTQSSFLSGRGLLDSVFVSILTILKDLMKPCKT